MRQGDGMLSNYEEERDAVGDTIRRQAEIVLKAHHALFDGIQGSERQQLLEARELLAGINEMAIEIDNRLIALLARFAPEARELRLLIVYLKVVNNIVRASDNIKSMSKHMIRLLDNGTDIALKGKTREDAPLRHLRIRTGDPTHRR